MIRSRAAATILPVLIGVSILGLVQACGAPDPGPAVAGPAALHVMSFNIRYGTADDGDDAWPNRRELALRTIADFAPHVVGVQEALRFQLDEIAGALPRYGEIGVGRDDGEAAGEYSAILYDRERLEPLASETFWLSDTPSVVASATWGNRIPRIVTWARFRDRLSGDTFYLFNTHWDHESQPSRERSAELLRARIEAREHPDPVIVTGDFNAGEANPAFVRLVDGGAGTAGAAEAAEADADGEPAERAAAREPAADGDAPGFTRLVDTYRAVHPDATDVGTFHEFTGEPGEEKIDAVLASPEWTVLDAAIVRASEDGRYPSDHFPVTAVLERTTSE